jgi:hypothetical protein
MTATDSAKPARRVRRKGPPVPLNEREQALELAANEAVSRFRALAQCWRDGDSQQAGLAAVAFDAACDAMSQSANAADLAPVIVRHNDAGLALLAWMAEKVALGTPPVARDPSTGAEVDLASNASLESLASSIEELSELELPARIAAYLDDSKAAPLAVGAHIAREGRNDPFSGAPWTPPDLGVSLAAAAITTVALIQVASAMEIEPNDFGSISVRTTAETIKAAGAAYLALSENEQAHLEGFGVASRVAEDLLLNADFLEDLDVADIHRLSGSLLSSFTAGFTGRRLRFGDEENDLAKGLLVAAHAAGFTASRDFSLMIEESVPGSVFGPPPGADILQ